MADTHSIHLVRPSQPKPNLDSADIALQALAIAKECSEALSALCDYHQMACANLSASLAQLEIAALRAIAKKAR